MDIVIPYKFTPRTYQEDLLRALDSGFNRAIAAYHRRAGKDKTLFNLVVKKAFERVGAYYYFFPEFAQGRRVIWDGRDGSGMKFLDHVPSQFLDGKPNSTEMKIPLKNGSSIQILGTDKFNKVRGSNPVGCVFSEYAFQNPQAWNIVRPILAENDGWAVFNSTPYGKNHFYNLFEMAKKNPEWFVQLLTVEDSRDENGSRYIPDSTIQEEREAGMSEEMIQQEFYCSFTANSEGFYYFKYIQDAREEGRVGNVRFDPSKPVETWWDIGVSKTDYTAIWFTQTIGKVVHVIDYHQDLGKGADHYITNVIAKKPYAYKMHWFPHDLKTNEWGGGRSRLEVVTELLGSAKVDIVPKMKVEDGINAVRMILPMCYFAPEAFEGLEALENYHRDWDNNLNEYKNTPKQDWSCHGADAFKYFAIGYYNRPNIKKTVSNVGSRFRNISRSGSGWRVS